MRYRITAEFSLEELDLIGQGIQDQISAALEGKVDRILEGKEADEWYDRHVEWVKGVKKKLADSIRVEEDV